MDASRQPLSLKCPQCRRPVSWTEEYPFRPFCCERCKLIDLGEWANEEKVIPGAPIPTENDDTENFFFQ
ncbi:DNA gyrase inhibitor YacG [Methyloglobulus morosus]|uniref:DNA gyrase inhibitor YacG n=1 Tax=Methyloglobulus morosus TaxID=1410681 RepID=UPI0009EB7C2B|nr:DNA gyrase inhibitor YacG [Methyloglobulus morosus]